MGSTPEEKHIYLDSSIIIGCIDEEDEKNKVAKGILNKLKSKVKVQKGIKTVISPIVWGEVLKYILEIEDINRKHNIFSNLYYLVKELNIKEVGLKEDTVNFASIILKKDKRIEPSDAIIIAHAFQDNFSTHLVTFDRKILTSKALRDIQEEIGRKKRLKITSELNI